MPEPKPFKCYVGLVIQDDAGKTLYSAVDMQETPGGLECMLQSLPCSKMQGTCDQYKGATKVFNYADVSPGMTCAMTKNYFAKKSPDMTVECTTVELGFKPAAYDHGYRSNARSGLNAVSGNPVGSKPTAQYAMNEYSRHS